LAKELPSSDEEGWRGFGGAEQAAEKLIGTVILRSQQATKNL